MERNTATNNTATKEHDVNLTTNEKRIIAAFIDDEYIDGDFANGATWVNMLAASAEMNAQSLGGIIASLVTKGIVWTNGESCGFTEAGALIAEKS